MEYFILCAAQNRPAPLVDGPCPGFFPLIFRSIACAFLLCFKRPLQWNNSDDYNKER